MKNKFATFIKGAIILCFSVVSLTAIAQKGEKSVGLRGGFTTRNTTATAGLYFSYRFSEHFRFAPKVDYAFRHKGVDGFSFNFDCESPIALGQPENKVNFYPILGLNYSTITSRTIIETPQNNDQETEQSDDSSQRTGRFGLNTGAGIEYFATPTLRLALEGKCQFVKSNTGGWFTLSIGYVF